MHGSVCCRCENKQRTVDKQCPFSAKHRANLGYFCPHSLKCFICDEWSCAQCRLVRADGEEVSCLTSQLEPHALFFDFDRTFATTRSGGNPMDGNHSIDADLHRLAASHPNVHIVTRNRHEQEIVRFCQSKGLDMTVHSVTTQRTTKADVIQQLLSPEQTAIFVDDDMSEHAQPGIVAMTNVYRVLFVRD